LPPNVLISHLGSVYCEHLEVHLQATLHAPFLIAQKGIDLKFLDASVEAVNSLGGVVVSRKQKFFSGVGDGLIWCESKGPLGLR
jgi:hypothetical protein